MSEQSLTVHPIRERIITLDVLRGFALFGVLLVNMLDFSGSALRMETLGTRGTLFDQANDIAVAFFAVTKFYLLFSFLFGVGFAVQMRRTEGDNRPFVGLYLRRLAVLLGIGILHAVLLWDGDILRLYALAGLLLLIIRKVSVSTLVGMIVITWVAGLIYFGIVDDAYQLSDLTTSDAVAVFSDGSYREVIAHRWQGQLQQNTTIDIQTPMVLVMFLLGMLVGREGFLDTPDEYKPFLRKLWKWALPVGLLGNVLLLWGFVSFDSWFISIGIHIGAPALSLTYACIVLLNTERLSWLAPIGQMALTNYLTHSLILTTLFYGYGLGLYDQLSPLITSLLAVIIFLIQVAFSTFWMKQFRFGIMEWLWRSITYWSWQPIRRKKTITNLPLSS